MSPDVSDDFGPEGDLRLQLQADLVFTPLPHGAQGWNYRIHDLARSRFFQTGVEEYALISLLDGNRTVRDAWHSLQQAEAAPGLSQREAVSIARWLLNSGLALVRQGDRLLAAPATSPTAGGGREAASQNLLCCRIPLCQPDPLICRLLPWLRWMHSPAMLVAWCATVLWAVFQVAGQWPRFSAASAGVLAPTNWLWLLGTVVLLKVLHEFSHAVACRRYGGRVGETGVMFVFFTPLAYIDVTSSWRSVSRWQRVHVALAGIYLESWVAAVAALWWCQLEPGIQSFHLYNIVLVGGVSSLLFNANPLMRADGYYVLSDLADIPNLLSTAMQQMAGSLRWMLWGDPLPELKYARWQKVLIRAYGPASLCWRLFVYASLILGASVLLDGAGVVLALLAIAFRLQRPVFQSAARLLAGIRQRERHRQLRLLLALAAGTGVVLLAAGFRWSQFSSAPGVIQYSPTAVLRARVPGFLEVVHVSVNQQVQKGDLLAELRNEVLQAELKRLKSEVEASHLTCHLLQRQQLLTEYRIEAENLNQLREQLQEKEQQAACLEIRAPVAGTVSGTAAGRDPATLVGHYFDTGQELLAVHGHTGREMRVSIPQDDAESFHSAGGRRITVRIPGRPALSGRVIQMTPRGSRKLSLPQLSAAYGGPVAVGPAASPEARETHLLLEPRFSAIVVIDETATDLRAGEIGAVSWPGGRQSAVERATAAVRRWIAARVGPMSAPGY